ncbi:MAG TPA: hypothetical protein DDZ89_21850 [Clostridiales bacterium]|nr:hypothetical protein [Clostridiales bacterium]
MSLIGFSHLREEGGVCQDASGVKTLQNGWVAAVIADGLGSAKHSDIGAKIAVSTVLQFVEDHAPAFWHDESLVSLLRIAYHAALKKIKERADADDCNIRDFDTTLTTVLYNGTNTVFGHVGDGGIIALNPFGEFSILTTAQKGEEFNMVTPLRSGPDQWMFGVASDTAVALLLLTDGLYDVACPWLLSKQEQKINIGFVRPFMDRNILSVNTEDDFILVEKEIEEFLKYETKHVTDDKTILGIINTDILPEIKSDEYYTEPDWQQLSDFHSEKLYGRKTEEFSEPEEEPEQAPGPEEPESVQEPEIMEVPRIDVAPSRMNSINNFLTKHLFKKKRHDRGDDHWKQTESKDK